MDVRGGWSDSGVVKIQFSELCHVSLFLINGREEKEVRRDKINGRRVMEKNSWKL